jgi:hypothetical protein
LTLKGQCHEIFCFRFFHESPSHKPLIITLGSFRIFRKFAEIFASQGAPPVSTTSVANLLSVSITPVANCCRSQRHRRQICHRYQRHWRQILPPVPLVLLTPVANLPLPVSTIPVSNLPLVSLTPVANNGNNIRLQTPESELKGKNVYICFLYYPKVNKQNY